jgi:hypothetical protein
MIWDILFFLVEKYPNSILKPLFLQTEALHLTTENTLAPFSAPLPANWKPSGSTESLEQHVKMIWDILFFLVEKSTLTPFSSPSSSKLKPSTSQLKTH